MLVVQKEYFIYIWEFFVLYDRVEEFRKIYGPTGDWVKLFTRAEGYLQTTLLQDDAAPDRFFTLDYWRSQEDFNKFKTANKSEFEKLDRQCEHLTVKETFLGNFYHIT